MRTVGLISDTHGLLRPEALAALAGSDLILHAGDIGDARILKQLAAIAPLYAVRGNNDTEPWARTVPEALDVVVESTRIRLLHDIDEFDLATAKAPDVVVVGHSHRARIERSAGVLEVNPGSAGPRRFRLPISVARMVIDGSTVQVEIVELQIKPSRQSSNQFAV